MLVFEESLPLIEPLVLLGDLVLDESVLLGVELDEPLLLGVLLVPPAAPVELEPDLLNWASHSEREIWPSLLVSTLEKLGVDVLLDELPEADGVDEEDEDGVLDEPLELAPVAEGDDDGVDDDEDDCATAKVDSANSTAAAVMLTVLFMD